MPRRRHGGVAGVRVSAFLLIALGFARGAIAHEVDHYILPAGTRFADLGPHLTQTTHERIVRAMARLNERIARSGNAELERLRSPDALAEAVCNEFPGPIDYIQSLERQYHDPVFATRYAGLIVAHRSDPCVYDGAQLPFEPRAFFLMWRSSLIRVNGVLLGTDKLGHFFHNGHHYYAAYRAALRDGADEAEALRAAVRVGVDGNFFLAERGLLGTYTSTVISNADLAANYAGLLFYKNLTEAVEVGGRRLGALAVCEERWRLAAESAPTGDFLCRLITPHFDELLNPNIYEQRMHDTVKSSLGEQCARIRAWYVDANGAVRPATWFTEQRAALRTYFGAEYGFIAEAPAGFVTIDGACFGAGAAGGSAGVNAADNDPLRRTALMRAVRAGDLGAVRQALGDILGAQDLDGETALHHAARRGAAEIVRVLLGAGAPREVGNRYGQTALHLAAARGAVEAVEALVSAGGAVDAADQFGRTALHAAAAGGCASCVDRLIGRGARVDAADASGNTPLHLAARAGRSEAAGQLIAAGASAAIANRMRRTAEEEAGAAGFADVRGLLATAGRTGGRTRTAGAAESAR